MKPRERPKEWDLPFWYQPEAPLGSAVRSIAALSPSFHWVGIYLPKGKKWALGPSIGVLPKRGKAAFRSEWAIPIKKLEGDRVLGQIKMGSRFPEAFGSAEEAAVRKIAEELGELWPE